MHVFKQVEKGLPEMLNTYSTARFKLDAREHILASANTFLPISQPMLASKDSVLSSKGNMLSCIILLTIEVDARIQYTRTHPASCSQ